MNIPVESLKYRGSLPAPVVTHEVRMKGESEYIEL